MSGVARSSSAGEIRSVLLHLGKNMWDDYLDSPDGESGSGYHPYVRTHDDL